jgi:nucleoid DNA-binding protein
MLQQLIDELYEELNYPKTAITVLVRSFVRLVTKHLMDGDSVVLKGIGTWNARYTKMPGQGDPSMHRITHDFVPSEYTDKKMRRFTVKKETTE